MEIKITSVAVLVCSKVSMTFVSFQGKDKSRYSVREACVVKFTGI